MQRLCVVCLRRAMQRIRFCGAAGCECEWESIPGRNYKLCPLCRHPVTELHFPSNQVAHLCRKLYSGTFGSGVGVKQWCFVCG